MNTLKLNDIAIWKPKLKDEFRAKKSPAGRIYFENNIARKADQPIFSYAKNYTIGDTKFCLFVMLFESNEKVVEQGLDVFAKTLKESEVKKIVSLVGENDFEYTGGRLEIK